VAEAVDYLLIGGGLACATAAERLRALDGEGSILLVGRELDPPYHRPPCSKGYLEGRETADQTYVHPTQWYEEQKVELLTRTSVVALDPAAHSAKLSNGLELSYRKALLATGANVRRLALEGGELEGIHYLRTLPNARAIREQAQAAEQVVLIGGSYIGCEVAASLANQGRRCTIVMLERQPFERTFGAAVGARFAALLGERGIELVGEEQVVGVEGEETVAAVQTKGGNRLEAQLVVVGAGVTPELRLARAAKLELGEAGGVRVDATLQTSAPDLYAAGDICEYPSPRHGRHLRLEHWDVAYSQGALAAENMTGANNSYEAIPYFFSELGGIGELEYVGPAFSWQEELVRELDDGRFTVYYLDSNRVVATLAFREPEAIPLGRLLIERAAELDDRLRKRLADPTVEPNELVEELTG